MGGVCVCVRESDTARHGGCRSVSPGLDARGLSRGLGSFKALGPVESGVSNASFETAREDVLSRMGSAAGSAQQGPQMSTLSAGVQGKQLG